MAKKLFTDEEIEILKSNPYTYYVSSGQIRFKKEFKQKFYTDYIAGKVPKEIVQELGYDLEILGVNRPRGIAQHIKEEYEAYQGFHDGKVDAKKPRDNSESDYAIATTLIKMQSRIRFLEQEVEFLKKILKAEK